MPATDIQDLFPDLRPITRAPTTFLLYLCGLTLYGSRDRDEQTRTEVTTHVLVILMVPLLALGAYRVQHQPNGVLFLGKTNISGLARAWNFLVVATLAALIAMWSWHAHTQSPEYLAGQALERGRQELAANEYPQAIASLTTAARSNTAHSQPAREELARCAGDLPPNGTVAVIRALVGAGEVVDAKVLEKGVLAAVARHVAAQPKEALALFDALPAKRSFHGLPAEKSVADHRAGEGEQGLVDDVGAFVAGAQLLPGMEPTDGSLDHPAVAPKTFLRFDPLPGDTWGDPALA